MTPILTYRLLVPLGLLFIVAGLLVNHFTKMPDFYQGGLMGVGIGVMIVSLIKQLPFKRSQAQ